jgi:glutaredoxin
MDHIAGSGQSKLPFYLKRITGAVILVALAATFFFSAYSKIYSDNAFDNFQWTFLDLGIDSVLVAGVVARLMIGFELMLGLFLLGHIYLKKFTYKAVIATLLIFIVYLLLVIMKQGNSGNCGCFGDKLAMTPLAAIWKNVAMILATLLLMYLYPVKPYKNQEFVVMALCLLGFSTPFVANRIALGTHPERVTDSLDMNLLYKYDPAPKIDLRKGKHIIAFMSLTCPHCKKTAYLLQIIQREHPDLPVYMVLDGSEKYRKAFFEETHAEQVPFLFYPHAEEFMELAGPSVPTIYWVNDGVVEYKSKYAYYQLDPDYMLKWAGVK